ncbi:MAG: hypothetical protein C0396_06635 [Anaerolinea sp.]|nr:hypothetical protein [Anaerolinea sp.]
MENDVQKKQEERKHPGVERVYKNDQIAIYWEPSLCIHVGNCYRGLPKVFDPQARPWVAVDADTADRIARVVETCPTGALHYERLDGGTQESIPAETTIDARPNGPLFIHGPLKIIEVGGHVIREDTRAALCRCGHSENKPFCDGTHRLIGFKTTK